MSKTINDYNVSAAEGARLELRRRHRDPLTGAKIKGHRNLETDGRMTRRAAFVSMTTSELVELANSETLIEPTLDADMGPLTLAELNDWLASLNA